MTREEHVPAIVAMGECSVSEFDDVGEGRKAVGGIEDFGFFHGEGRIVEKARVRKEWKMEQQRRRADPPFPQKA